MPYLNFAPCNHPNLFALLASFKLLGVHGCVLAPPPPLPVEWLDDTESMRDLNELFDL
jgi:hypothetical protein